MTARAAGEYVMPVCRDCLRPLTGEEHVYYEYRCDPCERLLYVRYQNWLAGKADPELDARFGNGDPIKTTRH